MLGKQTGFYTVEPKYIDDMVSNIYIFIGFVAHAVQCTLSQRDQCKCSMINMLSFPYAIHFLVCVFIGFFGPS